MKFELFLSHFIRVAYCFKKNLRKRYMNDKFIYINRIVQYLFTSWLDKDIVNVLNYHYHSNDSRNFMAI